MTEICSLKAGASEAASEASPPHRENSLAVLPLPGLNLPLPDFEAAGSAILKFVQERLGFSLCLLTRTIGDDWIVLQSQDRDLGVQPGMTFRWSESICSQMVLGNGPRIAPNVPDVPAYALTSLRQQHNINAYAGVPIHLPDGSLFGTLCAADTLPKPSSIVAEQPLLELLARLLGTILHTEMSAAEETRRSEKLAAEAHSDALTRLTNRRGWDQLLAAEEERCRRHGHSAAVVAVDLNGLKQVNDTHGHAAGDALIVRTAEAMRKAARRSDIVARLGGDEFGIIAVECHPEGVEALVERTRTSLRDHGVSASIGVALRRPETGLAMAWKAADLRMYEQKRATQVQAAGSTPP